MMSLAGDLVHKDVPRYLFRAYSRLSGGYNDESGFESVAYTNGEDKYKTLSELPFEDVRNLISDHVIWKRPWRRDNILISFTSSFLFALQMCIRKVNHNKVRAEDCYLCIIDTSKFPAGTWHHTVELLKSYHLGISEDRLLAHHYHEAEYLAEYEVNLADVRNASAHVSFQKLATAGLYDLAPVLDSSPYRTELVRALGYLRAFYVNSDLREVESEEIQLALNLGECFGGPWLIPMSIWALAIRPRPIENKLLCEYLVKNRSDALSSGMLRMTGAQPGTTELPCHFAVENVLMSTPLPEVKQWHILMNEVSRYQHYTSLAARKSSCVRYDVAEDFYDKQTTNEVNRLDLLTAEMDGLKVSDDSDISEATLSDTSASLVSAM